MLCRLVSTPTMMFGSPEETTAFYKRCRKRQAALRSEGSLKGERLFAERPRPFAERIHAYWLTVAGAGGKAVAEARDNVVAFEDLRTSRAS
jgi:hypothetical protein